MKPKPGDPNYRDSGPDFRYSIEVQLLRIDRPKYWAFRCNACGNKVCELDGQIVRLIDISNDENPDKNPSVRVACKGDYCRQWYYFTLV